MATKPTKGPEWASPADTDAISGQANVVEPPTARKQKGWAFREMAPRNWWNWWMNLVYQWIQWIKEPTLSIPAGMMVPDTQGTTDWEFDAGNQQWEAIAVITPGDLLVPIPLRVGDKVTGVRVRCAHSVATAGALKAQLVKYGATLSDNVSSAAVVTDQTITLTGIVDDVVDSMEMRNILITTGGGSMNGF